MKSFHVLHSFAAFCTFTNAYQLSLYGSKSCRNQNLGTREIKVGSGCQRDSAGNGAFAVIEIDTSNKDFGTVVLSFTGDDCKPSNIMQDGAAFVFENACWTGNYGSYEV
jgi:hypothetical protein